MIDLSHVVDVQDVLDTINSNTALAINASVSGNKIVIEDLGGAPADLDDEDHPEDGTYTLTYGQAVDFGDCRPITCHRHVGQFSVDLDDGEGSV